MRVSTLVRRIVPCVVAVLALVVGGAQGATESKPHHAVPAKPGKAHVVKQAMIEAPSFVLPRNAVVVSEVNLSDDDILGMIKRSIPAFTEGASGARGTFGNILKEINPNQLNEAIKGLKAVQVTHFKTRGPMDVNSTLAFMERQVPKSRGWRRIMFTSEVGELVSAGMHMQGHRNDKGQACVVAIYSHGKDFLGVILARQGNMGVTFGSAGFVDVPMLSKWAGRMIATKVNATSGAERVSSPRPSINENPVSTEPNMLKNPSFEEGLDGWTNTSNPAYSIDNGYPDPGWNGGAKDGSNWAGDSCSGEERICTPELRQVVDVTPGAKYYMSVWVFTLGSPNVCSAYLQWKDGVATADGQCTDVVASFPSNTGGWQQLSGMAIPTGSQMTYCLKLNWDCSGYSAVGKVDSRGGGGNFDLAEMRPSTDK